MADGGNGDGRGDAGRVEHYSFLHRLVWWHLASRVVFFFFLLPWSMASLVAGRVTDRKLGRARPTRPCRGGGVAGARRCRAQRVVREQSGMGACYSRPFLSGTAPVSRAVQHGGAAVSCARYGGYPLLLTGMPVLRYGRRRADSHGATAHGGNDDGLTLDAALTRATVRRSSGPGGHWTFGRAAAAAAAARVPVSVSSATAPSAVPCDTAGAAAGGTAVPRAAVPCHPVGTRGGATGRGSRPTSTPNTRLLLPLRRRGRFQSAHPRVPPPRW